MENTRVITVVATRGGRVEKFNMPNGITWGTLSDEINTSGKYPDLSSMKAVENVGKTTLELDDSVIPDGDIRIFLRPVETKSGADIENMSFSELRAYLKSNTDILDLVSSAAPGDYGKNWTQLTGSQLRSSITRAISAISAIRETVEEEVSTVDYSKMETTSESNPEVPGSLQVLDCLKDIERVLDGMYESIISLNAKMEDLSNKVSGSGSELYKPAAATKYDVSEEEMDDILDEMDEMFGGDY